MTPTTKAGKALLEREALNSRSFALIRPEDIIAIEREARERVGPDPEEDTMSKRLPFNPNWTLAPGATLREWREEKGYHVRGAATLCYAMPVEFYERIESGEQPIDEEIAKKLQHGTGIPSWLWMRLELNYRADLAMGRKDVTREP